MMHELFMSPFFGIGLSIAAFWVGTWIRKKTGLVLCNPLVLAIVIVSGVLLIFKIPYEEYNEGGALINMFLAPATACLAVSIYTRAELLKKNWLPIVVGASCGSLASMGSVLLMCKLFGMDEAMTVSLIPKSVDNLLRIALLRAQAHKLYIMEIKGRPGELRFVYRPDARVHGGNIPMLFEQYGNSLKFLPQGNPVFTYQFKRSNVVEKNSEDLLSQAEQMIKDMQRCLL